MAAITGRDRQEALADKRQKQKEREEKWVDTQIIGFTSWINSFIQKRGKKINKLETDFRDGLLLVDFLELASQQKLHGIDNAPKGKIHMIQNLSICLKFVTDDLLVRLLGINAGTIYDGNLKLILGMIWSIFRSPKITKLDLGGDSEEAKKGKKSFESQLLIWVRERVSNYGLSVADFKSSFNDGQVFAALVHSIDPASLNYDQVDAANPGNNLELAFSGALSALQVPRLLAIDDMTSGNPDERSVVLYTSLLFHAWTAAGAKAVDGDIKSKLQKEKEQKERMKDELNALKGEIKGAKGDLSLKELNTSGLEEENERLRKLLESLQRRSKAADQTLRRLEEKVVALDQLGGDADKKYFKSREGGDFLLGDGASSSLGGKSDVPVDKSAWIVRPLLSKGSEGNVSITHAPSGKLLSTSGAPGEEEGEQSVPSLASDPSANSEWKIVSSGDDGASALQNVVTGQFLRLDAEGAVSLAEDQSTALFDILSKSDLDAQQQRQRESGSIAAALKKAGQSVSLQNASSQEFVTGAPALSKLLDDSSNWEIVQNPGGSVSFRNLKNGQFLSQSGQVGLSGSSVSDDSQWWLSRDEKDTSLIVVRNKASGEYLNRAGGLSTSKSPDQTSTWNFIPKDVKLAQSLASALAATGGNTLLQNASTRGFVDNVPEITEEVGEDSQWEAAVSPDGNLLFKNKENGLFLAEGGNGELEMSGDASPSSGWGVSRGADGDLLLTNSRTGHKLFQKRGGLEASFDIQGQKASWILKSDNGLFSSSASDIGDPSLGLAIAAGLEAAGGAAVVEHGPTSGLLNNKPGLSKELEDDSRWEISGNPDGSLTFKSKENGQYLAQTPDGSLVFTENSDDLGARWGANKVNDHIHVRNKVTGNYLQTTPDGNVAVAPDANGSNSNWTIRSENGEFSTKGLGVGDPNLGAALGAALAAAGGNALVQHATGQDYLNNGPGLSVKCGDDCNWDISSNDDGSLTIKDKESGQVLTQHQDGNLSLSDKENVPASKWGVSKSPNGDLLIRSNLNGNYLQRTPKGKLASSEDPSVARSSWVIKTDNGKFSSRGNGFGSERSLGKALAAALQANGGTALVQNGKSKDLMTNAPGTSKLADGTSDWEITAEDDGSLLFKSKETGEFLSQNPDGSLGMSKNPNETSRWGVARGDDSSLVFRNEASGDFLSEKDDGSLVASKHRDPKSSGWVVKSKEGGFSSDGNFADLALEDGFEMGDGLSLRDLEDRNAALRNEIEAAKEKVRREMERREAFAKRMAELREEGDQNTLRAIETERAISELEEKADALQKLFDAERQRKRAEDDVKAALEKELLERETILREAMERRERALKKLDRSQNSAQREITKRKQREKEIEQLEKMKARLQQRVQMSERSRVGLDSLKKNLEEHLQDLSVWREHHKMESQLNRFDLKKIAQDLEGKPLEQQMDYLDGMLQDENRSLQRLLKVQEKENGPKRAEKVIKQGFLLIKGKKDWKKRWCVLAGQLLKYYSGQDEGQSPDGKVDLALGCDVVRQKALKDGKSKVWPLKLSISTKEDGSSEPVVRKLFLRASNRTERQSWFAAVSSTTSRINYLAETESSGEKPDPRIFSFISAGEETPIYELFVDFRPVTSAGMNALRKGILYHDELHSLSIQQGKIGDEGLLKLTSSLDKLTNLQVIRLSANRLSSEAVASALKALCAQTKNLVELDLSNNSVGPEAILELAALLKQNPNIHHLNLSGNLLGDEGVIALVSVFGETQISVPCLELANNKIGDAGATAVGELVNKNPNIGIVNLSGNLIRDEGAIGLAKHLTDNMNVTKVDLSGNNIGPAGAIALRECLLQNIDIHSLNLTGNPLLCGDQSSSMLYIEGFTVDRLSIVRGAASLVPMAHTGGSDDEEGDGEEEA